MINAVHLIGNVGQDPEVKNFTGGGKMGFFSLATESSYKNRNQEWVSETQWHNIVIGSPNMVDSMEKNVKKGMRVYVEGMIKYRTYENKLGQKVNVTEIYADRVRVVGAAKQGGSTAAEFKAPSGAGGASFDEAGGNDDLPF